MSGSPLEKNLKQSIAIAKRWLEKANDIEKDLKNSDNENLDYYDMFIYSFIAFNAFYNSYVLNHNEKSENQAITKYIAYLYSLDDFKEKIRPILEEQRERIKKKYYKIAIGNRNTDTNNFQVQILQKYDDSISDLTLLCAIVLNCYRIRCNLFHGSKELIGKDVEFVKEGLIIFKIVKVISDIIESNVNYNKGVMENNISPISVILCKGKITKKIEVTSYNIADIEKFIKERIEPSYEIWRNPRMIVFYENLSYIYIKINYEEYGVKKKEWKKTYQEY